MFYARQPSLFPNLNVGRPGVAGQDGDLPRVPSGHLPVPRPPQPTPANREGSSTSPSSTFTSSTSTVPANRACNFCRQSHAACDAARPCTRCVRTGKGHLCAEVAPRKRGRPPRRAEPYFPQLPEPFVQVEFNAGSAVSGGNGSVQAKLGNGAIVITPRRKRKAEDDAENDAESDLSDNDGSLTDEINGELSDQDGSQQQQKSKMTLSDDLPIADALHNLGKLVASITKEMQDIKRSNEELLQKVERLSHQQDESRRTIDMLLELERKREDKKLRREQRGLAAQQNTQQEYRSWHNTLIGTADPILGPPPHPVQPRQDHSWSVPPMIYEPSLVQPHASSSSSSSPQDSTPFMPLPSIPDGHSGSAGRCSFSSELALLQSYSTPRPEVLLEARLVLPFLQYYPMPSRFPIPAWSFAVCTVTTNIRDEDPPILSYANESFLQLINRPWEEIVGAPWTDIFSVHQIHYKNMARLMVNQLPMTSSDVFTFSLVLIARGKLLRVTNNVQFYYNQQGKLAETLMCVIQSHDEVVFEEGESLGRWIPLSTLLESDPATSSSSGQTTPTPCSWSNF